MRTEAECSGHNDLGVRLANAALGGFARATIRPTSAPWRGSRQWYGRNGAGAHPWNQVFDFNLDALADDIYSPGFQAQQLWNCLCQGLREQAALQ